MVFGLLQLRWNGQDLRANTATHKARSTQNGSVVKICRHNKTDAMNMSFSSSENLGADRIINEKQNVHCLPRLFCKSGLLARTTNAKAKEPASSEQISTFN